MSASTEPNLKLTTTNTPLLSSSLIQATSFAIERNLPYFETSAKTGGSGVDDTIDFLVEDAIKRGFYK